MERKKKANTLSIVFLRLCTQGFHSLAFSALITVLIITLSSRAHTMVSSSGCATAVDCASKLVSHFLGSFTLLSVVRFNCFLVSVYSPRRVPFVDLYHCTPLRSVTLLNPVQTTTDWTLVVRYSCYSQLVTLNYSLVDVYIRCIQISRETAPVDGEKKKAILYTPSIHKKSYIY